MRTPRRKPSSCTSLRLSPLPRQTARQRRRDVSRQHRRCRTCNSCSSSSLDNLCPNRAASLVQLRPRFATAAMGCVDCTFKRSTMRHRETRLFEHFRGNHRLARTSCVYLNAVRLWPREPKPCHDARASARNNSLSEGKQRNAFCTARAPRIAWSNLHTYAVSHILVVVLR